MALAADLTMIDAERLRANFAAVAQHGDDVAGWFYAHLFVSHPETRTLFPLHMFRQRDRLLGALGHIVAQVDRLDELVPFLQQLGRDHRKFGALAAHYPAVGQSLVSTLAHFSGEQWSMELEADWRDAYTLVAQTMVEAAEDAARVEPAWWDAEVIAHEQRAFDIAVIRVKPHRPLPYQPGQSLSVETELRPRLWRYLSPANAPREDGTIDFHVQLISGGLVGAALVRHLAVGDILKVGSPIGHRLVLDPASSRDLLLVAGGTGLAPLKALIEQVAILGGRRRVHLFHGARTFPGLYDRIGLDALAARHQWLDVTYALSEDHLGGVPFGDDDAGSHIERGLVGEVAARSGPWQQYDVVVCGSPRMVERTVPTLTRTGLPSDQIRFDEFTPR
jgi:NAD(P)H-flavin reductase/hemoglobin-like flavoprotein